MVAAATQGCALADCSQKAVVAFFVQQALQNTSNAYLAFAGNVSRTYTSRHDFVVREQLFSATLQQVAALNAGLKDFYLTVNEFADQTQTERNVVNGVKGLKKVWGQGKELGSGAALCVPAGLSIGAIPSRCLLAAGPHLPSVSAEAAGAAGDSQSALFTIAVPSTSSAPTAAPSSLATSPQSPPTAFTPSSSPATPPRHSQLLGLA